MSVETIIINKALRMMSKKEIKHMAIMSIEEFKGHIRANPKSKYMSDAFLEKMHNEIKRKNNDSKS